MPPGKVIGKGVLEFELEMDAIVPLVVAIDQETVVLLLMLLPVEMKVKRTDEPAHTLN